jgi:hypothetical protein
MHCSNSRKARRKGDFRAWAIAWHQDEINCNYLFLFIFLKGRITVYDSQQDPSNPIVFLPSAGLWSSPSGAEAMAMSTAVEEFARQRETTGHAPGGASLREILSQLTLPDIVSVLGLFGAALVVFWPY